MTRRDFEDADFEMMEGEEIDLQESKNIDDLDSSIQEVKEKTNYITFTILGGIEIIVSLLPVAAGYYTLKSQSDNIVGKTIDGISAPSQILDHVIGMPELNNHLIALYSVGQKYNDKVEALGNQENIFDRVRIMKDIWNTPGSTQDIETLKTSGPKLVEYELKNIEIISDITDNIVNETFETGAAVFIAYLFYSFLLKNILRLARLKDRDTLGDKLRKKVYRIISNKKSDN